MVPPASKLAATPPELPAERRARARARIDARSEEQRRSFLRMVSHELRTPLNSILGFSELIAAEYYGPVGAPEYKDYARMIAESGRRLLAISNQVLEIARLESGTADLAHRRESLDHALDDVLDLLHEEIRTRTASVLRDDEGRLPDVMADARGLRTALGALLSNALAFGPEGGEVQVTASRRGPSVILHILDRGPGVAPEDLPRLLRPFEQGQNALVRKTQGAGLGLPLAHMLCQAMGGGLMLGQREGGGLEAAVRLTAAPD